MAVDMVRRDVEQNRGVRVEAWRQVELEAGKLDHIIAAVRERRQVEHRLADIAAKHRVFANGGEDVMRERCRGGFAVRAGDGDHFGRRARRFALADENLGVADDLNAVLAGELHRPMRLGMGERHAGRQYQRINRAPIRLVQIAKRQSSSPRRLAPALAIVPGQNLRPARQQRPRRRDPRHPHAENGGRFPANERASIMLPSAVEDVRPEFRPAAPRTRRSGALNGANLPSSVLLPLGEGTVSHPQSAIQASPLPEGEGQGEGL